MHKTNGFGRKMQPPSGSRTLPATQKAHCMYLSNHIPSFPTKSNYRFDVYDDYFFAFLHNYTTMHTSLKNIVHFWLFLKYVHGTTLYTFFCFWLLSLSIMVMRLNYVVVCSYSLFIPIAVEYSTVCMYLSRGHLSCFWFLVLPQRPAMNLLTHVFWWTRSCISVGHTPRTGIAEYASIPLW